MAANVIDEELQKMRTNVEKSLLLACFDQETKKDKDQETERERLKKDIEKWKSQNLLNQ